MICINSHLADDNFLNIFSYLTSNELTKASCVCKRWKKLTQVDFLWNRLYEVIIRGRAFESTIIKSKSKTYKVLYKEFFIWGNAPAAKEAFQNARQISQDDSHLILGYKDGKIEIRDITTHQVIQTLETQNSNLLFLKKQGPLLITIFSKMTASTITVQIWNWRENRCLQTPNLGTHNIKSRVFDFNDKYFVFVGGIYENKVCVWDIANNKLISNLSRHTQHITQAKLQDDYLISGSFGELQRWNLKTMQSETFIYSNSDAGDMIAIRTRPSKILAATSKEVHLWDWDLNPLTPSKLTSTHLVSEEQIQIQEDLLLARSKKGKEDIIKIWNHETLEFLGQFTLTGEDVFTFKKQGNIIWVAFRNGQIQGYNLETKQKVALLAQPTSYTELNFLGVSEQRILAKYGTTVIAWDFVPPAKSPPKLKISSLSIFKKAHELYLKKMSKLGFKTRTI